MTELIKTVIEVIVLSRRGDVAPCEFAELSDVLEAMNTGQFVGTSATRSVHVVPADLAREELLAVGNDGRFFDELDDAV